ncbi:MAG: hypothetical protein IPJ75_13495 [Ignavibacteriales bacterium]|nr:hypothetical protein [Ignavibacteriales bacterium]
METELAFSNLSVSSGIKTSFLTFLSDSCVMHNEAMLVNGKSLYEKRSGEEKNILEWYPTYITAPEDGNLGLSTGIYKLTAKENRNILSEGRFYTIWQKEGEEYKVLFDGGGETNEKFAGFDKSKLTVSPVSGEKKSKEDFEKFFAGFTKELLTGKIDQSILPKEFIGVIDGKNFNSIDSLNSALNVHKDVANLKMLGTFFCESGKLGAVAGNFTSPKYKTPMLLFAAFSIQNDRWVMNCMVITE